MSTKVRDFKNKITSPFEKAGHRWNGLSTGKKLIVKGIIALVICAICAFLFAHYKSDLLNDSGSWSRKRLIAFFGPFAAYLFFLFAKNPFGEKINLVINTAVLILTPVFCFFMVELGMGTGISVTNLGTLKFLLNVIVYAFIMYLAFVITFSVRFSACFVAVVSAAFSVTNIYLMQFRQIPLLVSDFTVIGTAGNVAASYEYTITFRILLHILVVFAVFAASGWLKRDDDLRHKRSLRLICLAAYVGALCCFGYVTVKTNFLKNHHINVNTFRPIKSYVANGGAITMVRSIQLCMVEKPEGYSSSAVEEIASEYQSDSASGDAVSPNVIVVMDEAFSDLQSVGDFETNEEVIPVYKSITENAVKGFAYVSVFGGQTANSEYEFLTGDSKAFLPSGSTPYQLYIKSFIPSLTSTLSDLGYGRVLAMHPFKATGYNRINVYNALGFERFINLEDFEESSDNLVRKYISDDADFARIIEEYEALREESDDPFYMFNVTMQNHSPYDKSFDNLTDEIEITTKGINDADAERYLNLIHVSDSALGTLIDYFDSIDDPTVIVFFGDHEPGLSDEFYSSILGKDVNELTSEEMMELYKVPYLIWANYDIPEEEGLTTSLNYLQSIMMEYCGISETGYNKYLLDLSESIPVITVNGYFGDDGKYYEPDDKESPYYDKLLEYNYLVYNHLFGKSKTSEIFSLKGVE
ncbi:MAG: LTA synthase family protein [Eubacterium sp.]|nr:LTA synthase family protein [Eubacterium sp.]